MGGGNKKTVTRKGKSGRGTSGREPSLESWITFIRSLPEDQYYKLCHYILPPKYSVNEQNKTKSLTRDECGKIMWDEIKTGTPWLPHWFKTTFLNRYVVGGLGLSIGMGTLLFLIASFKKTDNSVPV